MCLRGTFATVGARSCAWLGVGAIDIDALALEKLFAFSQARDQKIFLGAFPPATWSGRDAKDTIDFGLDTVGTWVLLVAFYFSFKTSDT